MDPFSPVPVPVTALTTPLPYREHALTASATIGQPAAFTLPPVWSSSPKPLGVTPVFVTASRIRHAFFIAIDGLPVHSIDDVQQTIATVRQSTCQTARFTFTHDDARTNLTMEGVPQLYFD
jgi:hypothetical protein